jgi:hypothetical protein
MKISAIFMAMWLLLVCASSGSTDAVRAADAGRNSAGVHAHDLHGGHDKITGAHMLSNPAFGDQIFHAHRAGEWMVNYRFMHTDMKGLLSGTTDVPFEKFDFGSYMMVPTSMTMDMHMLMVMYGITDRFTLMGMANYQANKMEMVMGFVPHPPVRTSGFGDTELRGIYSINDYLTGSFGLSVPTGSISEEVNMMDLELRAAYGMQLGSGTFDAKPSLTYNVVSNDAKWNWGAQAMYTYHIGKNRNGYSLGDNFRATGWLQRAFGPATSWFRLAFSDTGRVKCRDPELARIVVFSPDNDSRNYGGQRLDGLLGVSYAKGPVSLGVEGGVPFYQYLNGLQLKTEWVLNAGIQVNF